MNSSNRWKTEGRAAYMRFAAFRSADQVGLAVAGSDGVFRGLLTGDASCPGSSYPGSLDALARRGREALDAAAAVLQSAPVIDLDAVQLLPPLQAPGKI